MVHVGGHIAFRIDDIASLCRAEGVFLLEDCAHAHGATFAGRQAGTWGDAGAYSFYATKTISTGEGGMLVSRDEALLEHARRYRNYGKPDHATTGVNFRLSEFTAALGIVQAERLDEIVACKNEVARRDLDPVHPGRLELPDGMIVRSLQVHRLRPHRDARPARCTTSPATGSWVTRSTCRTPTGSPQHHWCVPLYYRPAPSG